MSGADHTPAATVLLTGATGFVGVHLLPELGKEGSVRCLVRDISRWADSEAAHAVEADLLAPETLPSALDGVAHVYYLVHSMEPGTGERFAEKDRAAAQNFAAAARSCGVRRVIYLGGVSPKGEKSDHLDSRREVEQILNESCEELVVLRASMIVGAGSGSFRTLVQLVDRLPMLLLPEWRDRRSQPIAIGDVTGALLGARDVEPGAYDLAGPDSVTFTEMTEIVAGLLGEKHRSLPLPFSNAKLEAAAASVLVDADRELLEPLMAGLHSDLLVEDSSLSAIFGITPTPFIDAARTAIEQMAREDRGT